MKVKVLAANIMVDYKKVEKGEVIELADSIAERFVKAGLVSIEEQEKTNKKDKG